MSKTIVVIDDDRTIQATLSAVLTRHGYAVRVGQNAAQGRKRVAEANDFELAVEPQCNIVCFRHRPKGLEGAALDAHNRRVRQALLDDGSFYVVQTALPKGHFLRTTLMNPRTTETDLDALLDAVRRAARS